VEHLVELKDARDAYVHRVGKEVGRPEKFGEDAIVIDGFSVVRNILARVLTKTPEFTQRFVYRYLACWSCDSESPFIWDAKEGGSFYLGLGSMAQEAVTSLFAPLAGSFGAGGPETEPDPAVVKEVAPSAARLKRPKRQLR
jgi:hypothetical protein